MSLNPIDLEYLSQNLNTSGLLGSDSALGNVILLENRYSIESFFKHNILFRYYNYSSSINGFAFPLSTGVINDSLLEQYFSEITKSSKDSSINLCLFSQNQKTIFDSFLLSKHPNYYVNWNTDSADSDYIYLQKNLSDLPGQKYQKKRNHISHFLRQYKNINFVFFNKVSFSPALQKDFLTVEKKWLYEHENSSDISILLSEEKTIELSLNNISTLNLFGGILYIQDNPIAITLASKISDEVLDIHFEKCLNLPASYGGYAFINNQFAKCFPNFTYINREEDLGLEGLRKAKLSYKPDIILQKFFGTLLRY